MVRVYEGKKFDDLLREVVKSINNESVRGPIDHSHYQDKSSTLDKAFGEIFRK